MPSAMPGLLRCRQLLSQRLAILDVVTRGRMGSQSIQDEDGLVIPAQHQPAIASDMHPGALEPAIGTQSTLPQPVLAGQAGHLDRLIRPGFQLVTGWRRLPRWIHADTGHAATDELHQIHPRAGGPRTPAITGLGRVVSHLGIGDHENAPAQPWIIPALFRCSRRFGIDVRLGNLPRPLQCSGNRPGAAHGDRPAAGSKD